MYQRQCSGENLLQAGPGMGNLNRGDLRTDMPEHRRAQAVDGANIWHTSENMRRGEVESNGYDY